MNAATRDVPDRRMNDRRMGDGADVRSSAIRLSFIRLSVSGEHSPSAAGAGLSRKAAVPSEPKYDTDKRSSVAEPERS